MGWRDVNGGSNRCKGRSVSGLRRDGSRRVRDRSRRVRIGHRVRLGEFVQVAGWIRAARVGAADSDRQLRLYGVVRIRHVAVLVPECIEVHLDAGCDQLANAVEECREAAPALLVEWNCDMIATFEDGADQARQNRRRSDLDEGACAAVVHCVDHLDEAHRARKLAGELGPHRCDIVARVRLCGLVRKNGHRGSTERDVIEEVGEVGARSADDRRMECGRHRQPLGGDTGSGELGLDLFDRFGRA